MVSCDPLSSILSNSSAMKTQENATEEPDDLEPAHKGDILNAVLFWLFVQHKYRSSNKKLLLTAWVVIGTAW